MNDWDEYWEEENADDEMKQEELDLACPVDINERYHDGNTRLMHSAQIGMESRVSNSLADGADPLLKNNYGWTALMFATRYGRLECVKVLAEVSDLNAVDHNGLSCLEAPATNNSDCVSYLKSGIVFARMEAKEIEKEIGEEKTKTETKVRRI